MRQRRLPVISIRGHLPLLVGADVHFESSQAVMQSVCNDDLRVVAKVFARGAL